MIKNRKKAILLIAVMQICLLLNFTLANSYLIAESNFNINNSKKIEKESFKKIIKKSLNFLIGILSIKQIGTVSAASNFLKGYPTCCPTTENNGVCVNGLSSDPLPLCENPLPMPCSEIPECGIGCCYDKEEGICTKYVAKGKCENLGGEWDSDAKCTYSKCAQRGCTVGRNCFFETEKQCENRDGKFHPSMSYPECMAYSRSQIEGACVYDKDTCRRQTEKECVSQGGEFYLKFLCSNEKLGTSCVRQDHIGCYDGRDEIYWFDSCGNLENIYESGSEEAKSRSDNNGMILNKKNSCGNEKGNIESKTCGNCNRPFSICSATDLGKGVEDGDFMCKDLICKDAPARGGTTQDRLSGETWCIYDGMIDEGRDVVGSEHWIYTCYEGTVTSDRCGSRRSQICSETTTKDSGKTFTKASCINNDVQSCLELNGKYDQTDPDELEEFEKECNKNPFCMVKNIEIDDNFKFGRCVARFPKGAVLKDDEGKDENFCDALGSQSCTVYYMTDFTGEPIPEINHDCETDEFSKKLQDFCITLGDCGSYINYIGTGSDNVRLYFRKYDKNEEPNIKKVPWQRYLINSKADSKLFLDTKELDDYFEKVVGTIMGEDWDEINNIEKWGKAQLHLGLVVGAGSLISGLIFSSTVSEASAIAQSAAESLSAAEATLSAAEAGLETAIEGVNIVNAAGGTETAISAAEAGLETAMTAEQTASAAVESASSAVEASSAALEATSASSLGVWTGALTAFSLGMAAGSFVAGQLGRTGAASMAMGLSLGTSFTAFYLALELASKIAWVGWAGGIGAGVSLGFFIYTWASGWGETEEKYVDFKCKPWQAPIGEADCGKCNEDPLRPCTEYRCNAIGQVCKLLDPSHSEENPPCVSVPYEVNAPLINKIKVTPRQYFFTPTSFANKRIKMENYEHNKGCIQEFSKIKIDFQTDEFAQCKWSFKRSNNYEEMEENYPDNGYSFSLNHSLTIEIPSLENLDSYNIEGNVREWYKDAYIYIRCQDSWGNTNIEEHVVNFCINTEPDRTAIDFGKITVIPQNEAFLEYGATEQEFTIFLNKPADCRYSNESGIKYEDMLKNMTCTTDILSQTIFGWPCTTTLKNLTKQNNFYIKCKAQPWLEKTNKKNERAVNVEDYSYRLYVSESPLMIKEMSPNGTQTSGTSSAIVDLGIDTVGGAKNGEAICYYKVGESFIKFKKTNSNTHIQKDWNVKGGSHKVEIKCEDEAENIVNGNITFNVEIDNSPPLIIRAYKENEELVLITNEDAKCYYDLKSCDFILGEKNKMQIKNKREHFVKWEDGKAYYIKCKDDYGYINENCAMVIKPSYLN